MRRGRRRDAPGAIEPETIAALGAAARPLTGAPADFDALLDMASGARLVLLGEASHGTHEFYAARAAITRRLIAEHGFAAVVAEADWPDAERINCFVRGESDDPDPLAALGDFERFPLWMWRNTVMREFVGWLRSYNDALPHGRPRVGFYGMDLYSLHSSIEAVLAYLERVDPQAARRARDRYACFEYFGPDPQRYGYLAGYDAETCEEGVISQLMELRGVRAAGTLSSRRAEDEHFYAEQNARLVKNAEAYYRSMYHGRDESWNLRDTHMAETIGALMAHLGERFGGARLVVWAHNSHLGDARATEMSERGELNVGQLIRQRYGREALLVGFTTYRGEVTAASDWGEPAERKRVRDALPGSYETLLHDVAERRGVLERAAGGSDQAIGGAADLFVNLRDDRTMRQLLGRPRLERAIGVIYRPETERVSHYFHARLPEQFDAVLHFDTTRALAPLDTGSAIDRREPETLPTGL